MQRCINFVFHVLGLWNYVFLFSNLALFVLMPFAYLFTESEGLPGSRKVIFINIIAKYSVNCMIVFQCSPVMNRRWGNCNKVVHRAFHMYHCLQIIRTSDNLKAVVSAVDDLDSKSTEKRANELSKNCKYLIQ